MFSPDGVFATAADPRLSAAVGIDCTLSALAGVWLGHLSWREAVEDGGIRLTGSRDSIRRAIGWVGRNRFTAAPH
ncbi:hypothetical protein M8542_47845 [Amycolatopsis sp. OK19-0408]|uniref:Uncharacterized protein n=1 Tax=Amycolatopsis iheyensis TaxID=2945988 RepID=A0A9X2SRH9_9PSEU|nr:hypothetical protein [Amycolatopsis iheyensis]MCR6490541.1 hypothetical protein [Amycolatopsis iheyensis]